MSDDLLGNSNGLVSIPASDLRTALQSILGFTQLLELTGDNLTRLQRRYLTTIEATASEILAQATAPRPGRLLFERVVIDIDDALAAALARLAPLAESARVQVLADPSGLAVLGDREQLEQMLNNLLGCAITSTAFAATVRVRGQRLGEGVQLAISGTGIRVPRELTAARRLAEVMGGGLEWTHEADATTGITVRLPAAPDSGRRPSSGPQVLSAMPPSPRGSDAPRQPSPARSRSWTLEK